MLIAAVLLLSGRTVQAQLPDTAMSEAYWKMWNPEVQARIDRDIEANRKADAAVRVGRGAGEVRVEQISHDFLFGGNTFLFDDLGSERNNAVYRNTFGTLFNAATVAFYWKYLEPVRICRGWPRAPVSCCRARSVLPSSCSTIPADRFSAGRPLQMNRRKPRRR